MSLATLTWAEFLQEAVEFQTISERLGDIWTLYKKNDDDGNTFLIYQQKIPNTIDATNEPDLCEESFSFSAQADTAIGTTSAIDLLQIEYHVIYSISYQVPVLYFRIYRSDGSLVGLEESWHIFRCYGGKAGSTHIVHNLTAADMLSILTQLDHPVLQKPYLAIHPCRTAGLLAQAGKSRNRVLTFISLMGPFVRLALKNEYGMEFADT